MTEQQYLETMLEKYNLQESDIAELKKSREEVEKYIRNYYGLKISTFYYSGSYAKGTAIRLKYDLDLCVYFSRNSFVTLAEMYEDVSSFLSRKFSIKEQAVSIGIRANGGEIDVVPARRFDEKTTDANLFRKDIAGSIKTNIPAHKDLIGQSNARPIIKLLKIWKYRQQLYFNSFGLELLTIKALENTKSQGYAPQLVTVWQFICDHVSEVQLIDPANSKNNVSEIISDIDKMRIKERAADALNAKYWKDILW